MDGHKVSDKCTCKESGKELKTFKELIDEVSGMSEKEILHHEMEMLLVSSRTSSEKEIPAIAMAMAEIYDRLTTAEAIAPDIRVSVPDGRGLSASEVADIIGKMLAGQLQSVSARKTILKTYAVVFQNQRTGKVGMDKFTTASPGEAGKDFFDC